MSSSDFSSLKKAYFEV